MSSMGLAASMLISKKNRSVFLRSMKLTALILMCMLFFGTGGMIIFKLVEYNKNRKLKRIQNSNDKKKAIT